MSSRAFYKSSVKPKLIRDFVLSNKNRRSIEIWTTTCIVTNFGLTSDARCTILINPGNPQLSGVRNFTYFPRGGPVPKVPIHSTTHRDWQPLGFVSNWGGMEVGSGMMYPVSVVDGIVHQLGGWSLQAETAWLRQQRKLIGRQTLSNELCPVGQAIQTSAGISGVSPLREHYYSIVHTTPPFYLHDGHPKQKLLQCYDSALTLAFGNNSETPENDSETRVASPLLGAGARGFPSDVAMEIAVKASLAWLGNATTNQAEEAPDDDSDDQEIYTITPVRETLAFGLLEDTLARQLEEKIEHAITIQEKN